MAAAIPFGFSNSSRTPRQCGERGDYFTSVWRLLFVGKLDLGACISTQSRWNLHFRSLLLYIATPSAPPSLSFLTNPIISRTFTVNTFVLFPAQIARQAFSLPHHHAVLFS